MGQEPFDAERFSGLVPLFPLPSVVLFPGMLLPLHIFEPRYRQMTADALRGERLIAMALLKPGWQEDYQGSPPIHPIVGVGKIVEDTRLGDGRYHLVLLGLSRARVREEVGEGPYRLARVELLADREENSEGAERRRRMLLALYLEIVKELAQGALPRPPEDAPLGLLSDLVASLVSLDPAAKQGLLEELDPDARSRRLLDLLKPPPERAQGGPPRRRWPQGPSLN